MTNKPRECSVRCLFRSLSLSRLLVRERARTPRSSSTEKWSFTSLAIERLLIFSSPLPLPRLLRRIPTADRLTVSASSPQIAPLIPLCFVFYRWLPFFCRLHF